MLWPIYGFAVTLPCDREAAVAALEAAIAAARRQVLVMAALSFAVLLVFLSTISLFSPQLPGLGGFTVLLALVFGLFIALVPVMGYLQLQPWIRYLEELRRGIEEGRVNLEDVCGRPLSPYGGGFHGFR